MRALIILIAVAGAIALIFWNCDRSRVQATASLRRAGFSDVELHGLQIDCGRDNIGWGFTGRDRDGNPARGSVCCTVFGNCYARIP